MMIVNWFHLDFNSVKSSVYSATYQKINIRYLKFVCTVCVLSVLIIVIFAQTRLFLFKQCVIDCKKTEGFRGLARSWQFWEFTDRGLLWYCSTKLMKKLSSLYAQSREAVHSFKSWSSLLSSVLLKLSLARSVSVHQSALVSWLLPISNPLLLPPQVQLVLSVNIPTGQTASFRPASDCLKRKKKKKKGKIIFSHIGEP